MKSLYLKKSGRLYDITVKKVNGKVKLVKNYYTLLVTKDGVRKNYIDAEGELVKVK